MFFFFPSAFDFEKKDVYEEHYSWHCPKKKEKKRRIIIMLERKRQHDWKKGDGQDSFLSDKGILKFSKTDRTGEANQLNLP
jgi:hypothetical protein